MTVTNKIITENNKRVTHLNKAVTQVTCDPCAGAPTCVKISVVADIVGYGGGTGNDSGSIWNGFLYYGIDYSASPTTGRTCCYGTFDLGTGSPATQWIFNDGRYTIVQPALRWNGTNWTLSIIDGSIVYTLAWQGTGGSGAGDPTGTYTKSSGDASGPATLIVTAPTSCNWCYHRFDAVFDCFSLTWGAFTHTSASCHAPGWTVPDTVAIIGLNATVYTLGVDVCTVGGDCTTTPATPPTLVTAPSGSPCSAAGDCGTDEGTSLGRQTVGVGGSISWTGLPAGNYRLTYVGGSYGFSGPPGTGALLAYSPNSSIHLNLAPIAPGPTGGLSFDLADTIVYADDAAVEAVYGGKSFCFTFTGDDAFIGLTHDIEAPDDISYYSGAGPTFQLDQQP